LAPGALLVTNPHGAVLPMLHIDERKNFGNCAGDKLGNEFKKTVFQFPSMGFF
jgi:hypothetical protein